MARVTIESTGTPHTHRIGNGRHVLVSDEPPALGGQDAGMAPFELYLAALASCTAITLRMYAEKKGWDLGRFSAELVSSRDSDGRLQVHRTLSASGALDDAQWQRLLDVATRTPVTLAMAQGARITSEHRVAAR
ncbi:OsmC family protein [Stenotrophomonas mori]|uniref:OsmC family protein n=1 Tax=Stenotrophomonas mori TaxID=2871096 RepID=A0ABT0SG67_9GAMM|nr:OsmC family protein [Stenotrophomonas mori]MCL7714316.1 OsmC family protein [Stenotrophomonas mori]